MIRYRVTPTLPPTPLRHNYAGAYLQFLILIIELVTKKKLKKIKIVIQLLSYPASPNALLLKKFNYSCDFLIFMFAF